MVFISSIFALLGRIGLSLLFILSGAGKLLYPASYNAELTANPYLAMISAGSQWAVPLGIFELIAGVLILLGFLTRITAILLAFYSLLTALFLHGQLGDPVQQRLFLMQVAIAGGLFVLFAYGNTRASLDNLRARRRDQAVVQDRVVHDRPVAADGQAVAADGTVVTDDTARPRRRWW